MLPLSSSASSTTGTGSNSSSTEPPSPPNPILAAYEGWYQNTPYVTRTILSIQAISYLVSWFVDDFTFSLANIPHFILPPRYEVYRLWTSPLVNTSLVSLIFAYLSFNEQGKRLEYSMGSTRFATLCFSIGTLTNVSFFTVSVLTFYASGGGPDQAHILLSSSASGIWLVLFGIIAMECVQAPPGTQRKMFLFQVPVLYYPLTLLLFFTFLSASFSLAYCLSVAVGYLYGFGYLDRIQLNHGKAAEWEQDGSITGSNSHSGSSSLHCFASMTRRDGWVSCHAATGSEAWIESASMGGGGGGGMTMPLFRTTPGASNVATTAAAPSGSSRPGSVFKTGSNGGAGVSTSFAASSMSAGRTLGIGGGESTINDTASGSISSTTRRPGHHTAADARAARLQALEQRRSHYPDGGGEGGNVSNNSSKTQQMQQQS